MTEEELERERWIDDDYTMINQYYYFRSLYPNMPFYLQDEKGDTYEFKICLLYTSPSPRDRTRSRMPSSA